MKTPLSILLSLISAIVFHNCIQEKKSEKNNNISNISTDTVESKIESPRLSGIPSFISSHNFYPDSKDLKQKRLIIMKLFEVENSPAGSDYDTLVDINYDGYRDYVIGYYGLAGTGFKYRIAAYIFSKARNNYYRETQISELVNPSFFIPEHKITGFYLALGGGYGSKLEWIKGGWSLTKTFSVSNQKDSTIWEMNYPLTKKMEKVMRPYQMTPPEDVLEWNKYF